MRLKKPYLVIWEWEDIRRTADQPYLVRLSIFRCAWFGLLIHWFYDSDDVCLHDHPWSFISFILTGGYWETTEKDRRWYPSLSLLFRPAKWKHQVELKPGTRPITIVLHGPKERSWGFWTRDGYWIHWLKYRHEKHCT